VPGTHTAVSAQGTGCDGLDEFTALMESRLQVVLTVQCAGPAGKQCKKPIGEVVHTRYGPLLTVEEQFIPLEGVATCRGSSWLLEPHGILPDDIQMLGQVPARASTIAQCRDCGDVEITFAKVIDDLHRDKKFSWGSPIALRK
jgi:hypothetical protein